MRFTKGTQSKSDPYEFIMSDESVDRMNDVIKADGWDLSDFKKNPIALFGHNHSQPVGVWENVRVEGKKLIGRLRLATRGTSEMIDTLHGLVEQRIIKAVSVGFSPIDYEERGDGGFTFIKQALHECSLVSVPANPNALSIAKSAGMSDQQIRRFFETEQSGHIRAPAPVTRSTETDVMLANIKATIDQIDKVLS